MRLADWLSLRLKSWAGGGGPFGGHATLTDGLVSVWPLSEDGFDVVDGNDLTNNNAVTFVAKGAGAPANMPATVANFVQASSQYFSLAADQLSVELFSGFTYATWIYYDAAMTGDAASGAWNGSRGWNGYGINGAGVRTPRLYFFGNGENEFVDAGTVADDTWHLIVYDWDGSNIGISVNGGTRTTVAHPTAVDDTGIALSFGRSADAAGYLLGKQSSPMIWSRALTAGERTDLYASGDGLFY